MTAECSLNLSCPSDTPSECLTLSGKEAFMTFGDAEWKALPIAARPSFDQLVKGDLVEPDIHGTDMGRDPRKIARDVLAQYHPPQPVLRPLGRNVSIAPAAVLTKPGNAPCLAAHFGRSVWEPTHTGTRPTTPALASRKPERLRLPASSWRRQLP
jgi:hypothetical protein